MIKLTENDIKYTIKRILNEVRYLGYNNPNQKNWEDQYNQEPIKNSDRIRVYHGTNFADALKIAIEGVSGKEWHPRKYSYENGMNPVGLFVTTNFDKSTRFAYDNSISVIIEFTAKASDLDTPVWNNSDSYFGQGTNPQPFSSKEERETQKKKYNDDARKNEYDMVKNSDNPAMADRLFLDSENQTLFMGDLRPNMIKRFWVKDRKEGSHNYIPLSYKQFIRKYGDREIYDDYYDDYYQPKKRLYYPDENFKGWKDFIIRFIEADPSFYKNGATEENIKDAMNSLNEFYLNGKDYSLFRDNMFPKQIIQAIGEDEYREHFNKFY